MTPLISIDEAMAQLRIDGDADDFWLEMAIPSITGAVLAWLKDPRRAYETETDSNGDVVLVEDSNGDNIPLAQVKLACWNELAEQYRYRGSNGAAKHPDSWGHGYVLGVGATNLLWSLRKPTVA